jgi:hypothetical protein
MGLGGNPVRTLAALLVAATALSGCSAKWNTAYRTKTIGEVSAITIDAKQRHVLMQPTTGQSDVRMRMCAEPAPDVFAAIAASGSALIEVDAKSQTGAGQVGIAAAETAASIERTQTINLLRESFFRTCERYLSGAISKESFIVQAGRDARAMVAVLAIEQLTGAVRRPSTIISGPATSASTQAQSALADGLLESQERARKARADLSANAEVGRKDCSKEAADKKPACENEVAEAKRREPALQAASKRADEEVAQIVAVAQAVGAGGAGATTGAGTTQSGGGGEKPDATMVKAVAESVEQIAMKMLEIDDMRLLCIEKIDQLDDFGPEVRTACIGLMASAANSEAAVFRQQYEETRAGFITADNILFASFLRRLSPQGAFDAARNAEIVNAYIRSNPTTASFVRIRLAEMASATNEAEARVAFGKLSNTVKEALAKGETQ